MLPIAAMLYAIASAFIYFFSSFVPYEQHILSSVDRLLVVMDESVAIPASGA